MRDETLRCICGYDLAPERLVIRANSDTIELYCPNPNCRLGLIAIFQRAGSKKKLRLVKMIEEFNMLFMGTEELQSRMKHLESLITHRLLSTYRTF